MVCRVRELARQVGVGSGRPTIDPRSAEEKVRVETGEVSKSESFYVWVSVTTRHIPIFEDCVRAHFTLARNHECENVRFVVRFVAKHRHVSATTSSARTRRRHDARRPERRATEVRHARVSSDEAAAKRSLGRLFPRRNACRASVSRFVPVVPLGTSLTPPVRPPRAQGPRAPAIERRGDGRVGSPRAPDDCAPRLRPPDARPPTRGPRRRGARERHVPSGIFGKRERERERDWRLRQDRQLRRARDSRATRAEASVGTERVVQAGQGEARDLLLLARRVALAAQARSRGGGGAPRRRRARQARQSVRARARANAGAEEPREAQGRAQRERVQQAAPRVAALRACAAAPRSRRSTRRARRKRKRKRRLRGGFVIVASPRGAHRAHHHGG